MNELTYEIDRFAVACHEVGHALGARAAGLRVASVHIDFSAWDGRVRGGRARIEQPEPDAPTAVMDGFAVMLFAGVAAELRYLDQAGVLDRRMLAATERSAASDYQWWLSARSRCSISEQQARARASALIEAQWGRLVGRAELLLTRPRLAGSRI